MAKGKIIFHAKRTDWSIRIRETRVRRNDIKAITSTSLITKYINPNSPFTNADSPALLIAICGPIYGPPRNKVTISPPIKNAPILSPR